MIQGIQRKRMYIRENLIHDCKLHNLCQLIWKFLILSPNNYENENFLTFCSEENWNWWRRFDPLIFHYNVSLSYSITIIILVTATGTLESWSSFEITKTSTLFYFYLILFWFISEGPQILSGRLGSGPSQDITWSLARVRTFRLLARYDWENWESTEKNRRFVY